MRHSSTYKCEESEYTVEVIRNDMSWGNGVKARIKSIEGEDLGFCCFHCHPEFDEFEKFQALDTSAMLDVVVRQLESGRHKIVEKSHRNGTGTIFFRLNGAEQTGP